MSCISLEARRTGCHLHISENRQVRVTEPSTSGVETVLVRGRRRMTPDLVVAGITSNWPAVRQYKFTGTLTPRGNSWRSVPDGRRQKQNRPGLQSDTSPRTRTSSKQRRASRRTATVSTHRQHVWTPARHNTEARALCGRPPKRLPALNVRPLPQDSAVRPPSFLGNEVI